MVESLEKLYREVLLDGSGVMFDHIAFQAQR
jgi:hypothetical protein